VVLSRRQLRRRISLFEVKADGDGTMTGVNAVIFEGADSRMRVALEHIARIPAPLTPSGRGVVASHTSIQTSRQPPATYRSQ
jgi:hypothetical protein